jgi:hypothetical protein
MTVIRSVWALKPLVGLAVLGLVGMLASTGRAGYREAVLADGPIGYWTLDEGEGTAVNLGSLGVTANGEYFGEDREVDPGPGLPGFPAGNAAMRLTRFNEDGSETPIDVASGVTVEEPILDGLTAFTLEGWINPSEAENSNRSGLFGQDNTLEFGFIGANNVHFWAELPGGGDIHTNSIYEYDNDEWHHIAMTGDGVEGEIFLYIDGEEVDFTDVSVDLVLEDLGKDSYGVSGLPFNIGGGAIFGADRQYAGALDEIAAFDKYLTQEQIAAHYQAALEPGGITGDFDNSGVLDAPDIDDLTVQVAGGQNPKPYDLNADDLVNDGDIKVWVKDLFKSWIGDADLNHEFNSSDLVQVLASGTYEAGIDSAWTSGDFNGDRRTNSSDLVAALADGGYEQGQPPATAAVPEPAGFALLLAGVICLACRRRSI